LSTLYIRVPPRVVADNAPSLLALACPFAQVSDGGAIEREGVEPLSGLTETIARMQRVTLLLGGSNATVLRVRAPPLSAGRLKAALPNLVEELLLCEPTECVIVAGGLSDGLRSIAVMQRTWLDLLVQTFVALGARHIAVLPAQLCLSYQADQPGSVTAAINQWGGDIDMTLRLSVEDGFGLLLGSAMSQAEEGGQNEAVASVAVQTLRAVVSDAPLTLYVPQSAVGAYQEAANDNKHIKVLADDWSHWIAGARATTLDLMAGLSSGNKPNLDWRPWRWSLALAASVFLINAAALNIDWWRMKGETNALNTVMIQIYKSAYPKESVILDPLVQMQQKNASAKRNSGLGAVDDFTAITAVFGEAWTRIIPAASVAPAMIAAFEYREHSLFVHLKPVPNGVEGHGGEMPTEQMKAELAKRDFMLERAPEQSGAVVWKIRSAK